jgi:hypothetical protein
MFDPPCGVRRIAWLIVLALILQLPWSTHSAMPAHADHSPFHEPAARLQLVLNSVYIYDDNDDFLAGDGEIELTAVVLRCTDYHVGVCDNETVVTSDSIKFSAGNRETKAFDNQVIPADGGFPVYAGGEYMLRIMALEHDPVGADDHMGEWKNPIVQSDNWHIGSHDYRSWGEYYDDGTRHRQGDFSVRYEIRPQPLPDLHPTEIKVLKLAGTTDDTVCVAVENVGSENATPFKVTLLANDVHLPGTTMEAGQLPAGQKGELCTPAKLPLSARLVAIVDEVQAVTEYNETNNWVDYQYRAPQPLVEPGATQPNASQPDLTPRSLRVKGKEPSGQNDCDPGKNDITVVVKNDGAGSEAAFVVRLLVDDDDDDASLRTVPSLDAGKEASVEFGGVQLKKGERKLTATVDPQKVMNESKEDNNEIKISARCRDEGDDDD